MESWHGMVCTNYIVSNSRTDGILGLGLVNSVIFFCKNINEVRNGRTGGHWGIPTNPYGVEEECRN